jgi:hypothetical protein
MRRVGLFVRCETQPAVNEELHECRGQHGERKNGAGNPGLTRGDTFRIRFDISRTSHSINVAIPNRCRAWTTMPGQPVVNSKWACSGGQQEQKRPRHCVICPDLMSHCAEVPLREHRQVKADQKGATQGT